MDSVDTADAARGARKGPTLSAHFAKRQPSGIRIAGIRFERRAEPATAINVAIGNVSLPMHPAMQERLRHIAEPPSPFADGVVRYTTTAGLEETRRAFLHVIASSGFDSSGLHAQVTDGGSQAMEVAIVGCCGPAGSTERPLMLIDAAYTNYMSFTDRLGRPTVSIQRSLDDEGNFSLPPIEEIEHVFAEKRPGAIVVIPYDNPTGQLYSHETLVALARLCVKYDVWMISDEAYRELYYEGGQPVSVWRITESEAPGITGRRISIETSSKVWNACGLRTGALVTDNAAFHAAGVAENTAALCSNHIGQWIFGAIGGVPHEDLRTWYATQRSYYKSMMESLHAECLRLEPRLIVSRPEASLYSVVDVRRLVDEEFDALSFVLWCAEHGAVDVDGEPHTLLTAPMAGFYDVPEGTPNPGRTQMRVAYVEPPDRMALVPRLLVGLLEAYRTRG